MLKNLSFFCQLWTSDTQGDEAEAGEGGENSELPGESLLSCKDSF